MSYDVKNIQEALYFCKIYPGKLDGIMGPNTQKAIKEFQQMAGLGADGIVGPKTAMALSGKMIESGSRANMLKDYFQKPQ